jgi:G6PDH family F420-dependent oxidoreductase
MLAQPKLKHASGRDAVDTAIGFVLSERIAAREVIGYGRAVEAAGFTRLLLADRFQPTPGLEGYAPHAWVALAALGQRTRQILLGTSLTCPVYRYAPTVIAQAFATLGSLYPGRIFLGLDVGDPVREAPSGDDWVDLRARAERLVEAVAIIRRLWHGGQVTHYGHHFHLRDAQIIELPVRPVPLYIVAHDVSGMRLAGRYGDGLITSARAACDSDLRAAFALGAREMGLDPQGLPILAELTVTIGGGSLLPALSDRLYPVVAGSDPRLHLEAIYDLVDVGVREIYIHAVQPDQREAIAFYANEVLPQLRQPRVRLRGL